MSHIGRLPIFVPQGVEVKIEKNEVTIRGSMGKLTRCFHPDISIALQDGKLIVTRPSDSKVYRALHGLTRNLLANMVEGVTNGFKVTLELVGTGYRARMEGKKLVLALGFSHDIDFPIPDGVEIKLEGKCEPVLCGSLCNRDVNGTDRLAATACFETEA